MQGYHATLHNGPRLYDRIFWDKGTQRHFFDEEKSTLPEEDATAEEAIQNDWAWTDTSPFRERKGCSVLPLGIDVKRCHHDASLELI
jgi:hypothetical protein